MSRHFRENDIPRLWRHILSQVFFLRRFHVSFDLFDLKANVFYTGHYVALDFVDPPP